MALDTVNGSGRRKQGIETQMIKTFRHITAADRGFTLMELLVVLTIIGLLAALAGPTLYKRLATAKHSTAKAQIEDFTTALDDFFIDVGRYPTAQEGLDALFTLPPGVKKWNGPYLKKQIPADPWDRPYIYRNPGKHGAYEILSYGADGRAGGEGEDSDIYNWSIK
jgi:general secretion pathway protein G